MNDDVCLYCVCLWFPQLILGAQCQATRDAQIQEKKQIQTELTEEEKRLDAMMEVERRRALETVDKIDELRKQQRIRWMQTHLYSHKIPRLLVSLRM